jgi:hypothetical protein
MNNNTGQEVMKAVARLKRLVNFPKEFEDILLGFKGKFDWDFSSIQDPIIRRHAELRYRFANPVIREIVVSESYLLLMWGGGILAFGVTEEGRLFLNELGTPGNGLFTIPVYHLPDQIRVSASKDYYIRELFGFEEFAPDGAVLSTEGRGRRDGIRLQGEVVADLYDEGIAKDMGFKTFILKCIRKGVENHLANLVTDLLWGAFLELGFSPRIGEEIEVPLQLRSHGFRYLTPIILDGIRLESVRREKNAIPSLIRKYFQVRYSSPLAPEGYGGMVISSNTFGEFDLITSRSRDDNLKLLVVPRDVENAPIMAEIMTEITDAFKKALHTRPEISLWIGSHKITLKNFATRTISLSPPHPYKPIFLWNQSINIDIAEGNGSHPPNFNFISLPDAEIRLEHREHGTKVVYVEPQTLLRLRTTNVSAEFNRYRNEAVMSLLTE